MVNISMTAQLNQHRQHFPYLEGKGYFNYGGQGPMPQPAIAAIQQAHDHFQQAGPFSSAVNSWIVQEGNLTRAAIASELGVSAESIALTEDVSVGCNIALWGLDWQAGDHLLLTDCEHQGIIAATQELQRRFQIEVSVCPMMATLNQGDPVAVMAQHLRPNTRLVVLSHILWNTGQVLPLSEIVATCRSHSLNQPIRILVDAAQSVGMLPLNLTESGVDFYAFTGHKWWCGAAGLGGLYVRPDARDSLHPTFIGWRSITIDAHNQPTGWQPDSRRYEIATSAIPLYAGLRAAIAFHHTIGTAEERYGMICDRSAYLWQRLTQLSNVTCLRSTPPQSGLVSFQLASGEHVRLVQFLESKHFFLRVLLDPNCVRACVHYFTTETEIDALVSAIAAF
ncbi:aminotransferase class V-fold PLP-dependent enzyme [Phormidesmis sp. 146-35]